MRFVAASFIHILTILCAVSAFGAEEITHISVIQANNGSRALIFIPILCPDSLLPFFTLIGKIQDLNGA